MYSFAKSVIANGCIGNSVKSCEGVLCQFVRFRKPRYRAKAPSKMYDTKPRKVLDLEELSVFRQWQNVYNTEMRSIIQFLRKYNVNLQRVRDYKKSRLFGKKHFDVMQEANAAWNAETAALKEAELTEKTKEFAARLEAMEEREIKEREAMTSQARQTILKAKENEDKLITPENVDARLEELLSQRKDYDFAVFLDGSTTTESFDSGKIEPFENSEYEDKSSETASDAK